MKRKILAMSVLGMCALAFSAGEANAFFGLLSPYHPSSLWHRHNRYVTQITCRPYNAFTPICWGNLVCDGCCPSPCGVAGGQMPQMMCAPPWSCPGYGAGPGCCGPEMGFNGGFNGGYMASDMPLMAPPPPYGAAPMPQPQFTPPAPMPLPNGPNIGMMPYNGVAQANYYPMYPQQYYPNYYQPSYYNPYMNMQPAPYYWYGGR